MLVARAFFLLVRILANICLGTATFWKPRGWKWGTTADWPKLPRAVVTSLPRDDLDKILQKYTCIKGAFFYQPAFCAKCYNPAGF